MPLFLYWYMKRVYINSLRKYADEVNPDKCPNHLKHLLHDTTAKGDAEHGLLDVDREDEQRKQSDIDTANLSSDEQGNTSASTKPKPRRTKRRNTNS